MTEPLAHRWAGRPRDAGRWYDEKRRHAPYYIAVGGATIAVGLLILGGLWTDLDGPPRWMFLFMVLGIGGTVLAFGPLLYWLADKHTVFLPFPMGEGWDLDLDATWGALTGYLASEGLRWRPLRAPTSQARVLGLDGGLRVLMQVIEYEHEGGKRTELMVSIHRINEGNVDMAERLQRTLDAWPLLHDLEEGLDGELAEIDAEMAY